MLTTGAVLIFRPIAKRLTGLLEAITAQKLKPAAQPELSQIRDLLTGIDRHLNLLEERQDFAEALLTSGERRTVSSPPPQDVH
jgi:hypothetical protein